MPHFLYGDDTLYEMVEGLSPKKDEHEIIFHVDPVCLYLLARFHCRTRIWFGRGCAAQASKPSSFSKDHYCQKRYPFLRIFLKYRPIFQNFQVFVANTRNFWKFWMANTQNFGILEKWTHVQGFFLWKVDPCLWFLVKKGPIWAAHRCIAYILEYPPPRIPYMYVVS